MSKPAPGTYYIVNLVHSPEGEQLAVTFNGSRQNATVTPFASSTDQRWVISDFDGNTQIISPASNTSLQAAWGDSGVIILPGGLFTWTLRINPNGLTIRDGNNTVFWGLQVPIIDGNVSIGHGVVEDERLRWVLSRA